MLRDALDYFLFIAFEQVDVSLLGTQCEQADHAILETYAEILCQQAAECIPCLIFGE